MIWNSKNSTYYDKGKKAYSFGDEIPEKVLEDMCKETLEEYIEKGLISDVAVVEPDVIDEKEAAEAERQSLLEKAISYGLKPHPKTGIAKLEIMVADYEALQALRKEALELGIDASEDLTFADLKDLVDEKKADDEPDS